MDAHEHHTTAHARAADRRVLEAEGAGSSGLVSAGEARAIDEADLLTIRTAHATSHDQQPCAAGRLVAAVRVLPPWTLQEVMKGIESGDLSIERSG